MADDYPQHDAPETDDPSAMGSMLLDDDPGRPSEDTPSSDRAMDDDGDDGALPSAPGSSGGLLWAVLGVALGAGAGLTLTVLLPPDALGLGGAWGLVLGGLWGLALGLSVSALLGARREGQALQQIPTGRGALLPGDLIDISTIADSVDADSLAAQRLRVAAAAAEHGASPERIQVVVSEQATADARQIGGAHAMLFLLTPVVLLTGLAGIAWSLAGADTSGAFSRTRHALLVVLVLSSTAALAGAWARRQSTGLLSAIDRWMAFNVLARLSRPEVNPQGDILEQLAQSIAQMSQAQQEGLGALQQSVSNLQTTVRSLPAMVDETSKMAREMMSGAQQQMQTGATAAAAAVDRSMDALQDQVVILSSSISDAAQSAGRVLDASTESLRAEIETLHQPLEKVVASTAEAFEQSMAALREEIRGLSPHMKEAADGARQVLDRSVYALANQIEMLSGVLQSGLNTAVANLQEGLAEQTEATTRQMDAVRESFLTGVGERGGEVMSLVGERLEASVGPLTDALQQAAAGMERVMAAGEEMQVLEQVIHGAVGELTHVQNLDEAFKQLTVALENLRPLMERLSKPKPVKLTLAGINFIDEGGANSRKSWPAGAD